MALLSLQIHEICKKLQYIVGGLQQSDVACYGLVKYNSNDIERSILRKTSLTNVIKQYTDVDMISAIILYQFTWLSLGMQERLFDRRGIAMWSPNGGGDGSEETIYEP